MALDVLDTNYLMRSFASAGWLLKTSVTGTYASELEHQFIKVKDDAPGNVASKFHRMDAIITALYAGPRNESIWLGCLMCAEHFILFFRVYLYPDDPHMELRPTPTSMISVACVRDRQ